MWKDLREFYSLAGDFEKFLKIKNYYLNPNFLNAYSDDRKNIDFCTNPSFWNVTDGTYLKTK